MQHPRSPPSAFVMSDAYTQNWSETYSQSYGLESRTDRWSGSGTIVFTGCV
jgi:hypothetical protein